jgi:hypothetical protein
MSRAFELARLGLRQRQAPSQGGWIPGRGTILMKTIRPDNTDPIPLRVSPHRMGTIMIRFVGLLVLAVVVLALVWNR